MQNASQHTINTAAVSSASPSSPRSRYTITSRTAPVYAVPDAVPQASLSARLRERLRDTRGFMLAEYLVSIIFLGLLAIAVAAGLQAALSSYSTITTQTQASTMLSRTVDAVSNDLTFAKEVDATSGATGSSTSASYVSPTTRTRVALSSDASAGIVLTSVPAAGATGSAATATTTKLVPASDNLVPLIFFTNGTGGYTAAPPTGITDTTTGTWSFSIYIVPAASASSAASSASQAASVALAQATDMHVQQIG